MKSMKTYFRNIHGINQVNTCVDSEIAFALRFSNFLYGGTVVNREYSSQC